MKGTLKLTGSGLIRLSEFSGTCFEFNGENYLAVDYDGGPHVTCVNLSGPTIVNLNPDIQITPIDLEIIVR